jgi:uncharacterized protein
MKKLLSIDGGGIRGLIPALVLQEIERHTKRPIAESFDLIAGTSTGGILAMGLATPDGDGKPAYSARQLIEIYDQRGRDIFARSFWKGMSSVGGLADERYDHRPLERVLGEYFGEIPLASALTNVLISSYDIEAREPFFFKSWRENTNATAMREAARATSAAPTYFEPARVVADNRMRTLVDGGVFVNNPAMSAYAEARRLWPNEERILLVALGTGELTRPIRYEEARSWGLVQWAVPLLNVVFDGVADAVDYQLRNIIGDDYLRLQTELDIASDDLDNASRANIEALKAEAKRLLRRERATLERLYELLA